ncbi:sensor histidine kinase [Clostridium sp.]|uniref:sensor histidine kinase n=1 Tax=Clostridium sp. TaxID=1506 RepID=UPI003F303BC6
MRWSIKNKITASLAFVIVFVMIFSTVFISKRIQENIEGYIKNDMDIIVNYSKEVINTSIKSGYNDKWNIVSKISDAFNIYVSFVNNEGTNKGKVINKEDIAFYIRSSNKDDSYLKLTNGDNYYSATLMYPIYIEDKYEGKLILQKDYTDVYKSNYSLLLYVLGSQIILTLILILTMYFIVNKITRPLTSLTYAIKKFGEGKEVNYIEVKTNDEIGEITKEFNQMKKNINELNNTTREFFNLATHELKTPLTAIRGYSQMLTEEEFEDEFTSRAISRIEKESIKMSKLIENLLSVARSEANVKRTKELFNVKDIINDALVTSSQEIINKDIKIELSGDDFFIEDIKEDLQLVISNLINNAVKYTKDKRIKILLNVHENKGELIVENTQDNITEKIKNNLFTAFVKSDPNKREISSSGLGLYICKILCSKNRWDISHNLDKDKISFILKIIKN